MDPKSMKNRGCVADAFLERFWRALGRPGQGPCTSRRTLLATIFHQKPKKWHPKKHPKIDAEKVSEMYAKRCQKGCQNGPKRDPKGPKRSPKEAKGSPKGAKVPKQETKMEPKGAKREPKWSQSGSKIDAETLLEKGVEKSYKNHPKTMLNEAKMHQKSIKNESQKKDEFSMVAGGGRWWPAGSAHSAGVPQFAPVKVNLPAEKQTKTEKQHCR